MREIKAGDYVNVIEDGEVFKYISYNKHQYTLISLSSPYGRCNGCVFCYTSNHPLSSCLCSGNGLDCNHSIFKSVDDVLEDL